jgi:hypothetical protein
MAQQLLAIKPHRLTAADNLGVDTGAIGRNREGAVAAVFVGQGCRHGGLRPQVRGDVVRRCKMLGLLA